MIPPEAWARRGRGVGEARSRGFPGFLEVSDGHCRSQRKEPLTWHYTTSEVERRRWESNPCTGLCRPLPEPLGHVAIPDAEASGAPPYPLTFASDLPVRSSRLRQAVLAGRTGPPGWPERLPHCDPLDLVIGRGGTFQ